MHLVVFCKSRIGFNVVRCPFVRKKLLTKFYSLEIRWLRWTKRSARRLTYNQMPVVHSHRSHSTLQQALIDKGCCLRSRLQMEASQSDMPPKYNFLFWISRWDPETCLRTIQAIHGVFNIHLSCSVRYFLLVLLWTCTWVVCPLTFNMQRIQNQGIKLNTLCEFADFNLEMVEHANFVYTSCWWVFLQCN